MRVNFSFYLFFQHLVFVILIIFSFFIGVLCFFIGNHRIDFSQLERYNPGAPSIILDDQGNEWARFQLDKREPVPLQIVPTHVLQAFVAAEDHSFWKHHGISWKGIIRSFFVNLYHGKIIQGASTITQQLVKLLFFDSQKTLIRKIKEQFIALLVEYQFSKEQILQTYVNHVYFGCGIYGLEAASQRFWAKSVTQISIDEAAVLAAIVRSPGQYCPLLFPRSSKRRRDIVLRSMQRLNFISQDVYQEAINKPLFLIHEHNEQNAPYVKEMVRQFLEKVVGKESLYSDGFVVQTTINLKMQKKSEEVFKKQISTLKQNLADDIEGALICMHAKSGEIKALIGGVDFNKSQFNRAIQAKRQFGSIFKPIVYAAALNQGMTFAQTQLDEPLCIKLGEQKWEPQNYAYTFDGQMTLAHALSHSNNIVAIKTLLTVGIDSVVALARRFRLKNNIPEYPSLALGCLDGSLKEAIGMLNVFANDGIFVEPYVISWIKNNQGFKIWKRKGEQERVLSSIVNGQIARVLSIGLNRIRARHQTFLSVEALGKTGTTNECRTHWFCGSTPTYTTALYLGFDDNRSMGKHLYPAATVFPIWAAFNQVIDHTNKQFYYHPQLQERVIHSRTGLPVSSNHPNAISILVPIDA